MLRKRPLLFEKRLSDDNLITTDEKNTWTMSTAHNHKTTTTTQNVSQPQFSVFILQGIDALLKADNPVLVLAALVERVWNMPFDRAQRTAALASEHLVDALEHNSLMAGLTACRDARQRKAFLACLLALQTLHSQFNPSAKVKFSQASSPR